MSLATIVLRLIEQPEVFTKSEFVAGYPSTEGWRSAAEQDWEKVAGSGEQLDGQLWEDRLHDVKRKCDRVKTHVDTSVAHNDRNPPVYTLTLREVHDDAIEAIGELYSHLLGLIEQASPCHVLAEPVEGGWDSIFTLPWTELPQDATP